MPAVHDDIMDSLMGDSAKRLLTVLVDVVLLAGILFVLFVLFTGRYELEALQLSLGGWKLAYSIIGVVVLVLLRRLLKKGTHEFSWSLLLFSLVLIAYLSNGKTIARGDSIPARYLPLSILQEGNFDLDEFDFLYKQERPFFLSKVKRHVVSNYPVGAPLLAVPFYAVTALGNVDPRAPLISELEKISASVLVALSVLVLYRLLLLLTTQRYAMLLALIYAIGTSSFSTSSQALWQHGPSQLALTAALYALFRGQQEPRWLWLSGFFLSFSIICRPTDALIVFPIGVYVLFRHRSHFLKFLLCAFPPAIFQLLYNYFYFGNPFRMQFSNQAAWTTPFLEGLAGLLISPGRGLFVYSPIFLFSLIGFAMLIKRRANPIFPFMGAGLVLVILVCSRWNNWWGGGSFGYRLLADTSPFFVLFLYPLRELLINKRMAKVVFVILSAVSVIAHSIGVYDPGMTAWNVQMDVDNHPENLWLWNNNQLVNPIRRTMSRASIMFRGAPTSRDGEGLKAAYSADLTEPVELSPFEAFEFTVKIINTGEAVWIAGTNEEGSVRLRCNWLQEGRVLNLQRVVRLLHDVPPGQYQELRVSTVSPRKPGTYTLQVELFTDRGSFSDQGIAPLRVKTVVR